MHPDKKAGSAAAPDSKGDKRGGNKRGGDKRGGNRTTKEAGDDDDEATDDESDEGEEDEDFKLLSRSWELLGNAETRRAFDSVDYFNDHLPTAHRPRPERGSDYFFRVFAPPFRRQAKFSIQTPVPALGDADTPYEQVAQ